MTYQSIATLAIIAGAFSAAGGILALGNYIETGKFKRPIMEDGWSHGVAFRDEKLKKEAKK